MSPFEGLSRQREGSSVAANGARACSALRVLCTGDHAQMGLRPTSGLGLSSNDVGLALFIPPNPSGAPMARTPTSRGAASKSPSASPSSTQAETYRGNAGELQQQAGGKHPVLTTQQGIPVADNQNSLRAHPRGPTLLEDFILREKITHFDHERIPERIVHARGIGRARLLRADAFAGRQYTTAKVLTEVGVQDAGVHALFHRGRRRRARSTRRAMCAASRSSSTHPRATGTWWATTSRCSSSRTRSSSPT